MKLPNFIFLGPSLSKRKIIELFPNRNFQFLCSIEHLDEIHNLDSDLCFLPPVSGGDLYSLSKKLSTFSIAIIDGYFENTTSVWHKEILYLLSRNIPVFGAASMGALRASELNLYGMQGVGKIYSDYLSGLLEDDDEVTVAHGPRELDFPCLSTAMVNIRATASRYLRTANGSKEFCESLLKESKALFYKYRTYERIIERVSKNKGLAEESKRFLKWLPTGVVDQKENDSIELLQSLLQEDFKQTRSSEPFVFENSSIWRHFIGG